MSKEKSVVVKIPQLRVTRVKTKVVGDNPFIPSRIPPWVKENLLNKQHSLPLVELPEDPEVRREATTYHVGTNGQKVYGIKRSMVKASCIEAAPLIKGVTVRMSKGGFRVVNGLPMEDGVLIPIEYKEKKPWGEVARNQKNNSAVVPELFQFIDWSVELVVEVRPSILSVDQFLQLLSEAGSSCGWGTMRPGLKGYNYGTFHLEAAEEMK